MKMVIACVVSGFFAVGCAAEPASSSTQEVSLESVGDPAAAAALDCSDPFPTCREFCTCQFNECIASGGVPSLCRKEFNSCFWDLCR